ncbi:MAG TPA: tRNA (adenosine(37)-N6)-threonylcarbamoyltransferase complex dimerization subunit type 1 TsaB [Actinomycetota bacterium]|nr:tRNA (adenosine(37)-N6)-threonylcarbamoyltransferase complex dimerization subunit type 1 TsaB [Actinomycetota bacterium]
MLALAIETSTPQTSVALGTEQGVLSSASVSWARGHSEVVVPAIEQVLEWSETDLSQLGGVAVGLGPGLFTGLRAGVATARALAQVLNVPVVGIPSLDVLAFAVRQSRWRIGAVLDGKRGEVFYAFYRPVPGGVTRETDYGVGPPERLAAELAASREETLLVGNGALLYARDLEDAATPVEMASASTAFPDARALLELAIPRFHREETSRFDEVVPMYVRRSDAEINWSRRANIA